MNWHLNYFLYIVYVYDINLLIFCQCSNQPLVYPKIDLPGREKTKSLSLFIAAILQHSLLYSTFSFRIQWPASVSASKPLLPLFHSAIPSKPYKPSLFPVFPVFFGIGEGAWEGLVLGMHGVDAATKKEAGPDEFLWNSSDSASCFLCSFSLGHLDES